ncbi:MAG TPA: hypothetical protein VF399_09665 [bacterium]|jgi:ribosomal protein S5
MMIILLIAGGVILAFIVLAVLDHFNITHIFMKGRASGTAGNAMRAVQDALEPSASKAHEYIIEQQEEKDKSQDKAGSKK